MSFFEYYTKAAGLFSISFDFGKNHYLTIHFFPRKGFRQWGYMNVFECGRHRSFSLGPLIDVIWSD